MPLHGAALFCLCTGDVFLASKSSSAEAARSFLILSFSNFIKRITKFGFYDLIKIMTCGLLNGFCLTRVARNSFSTDKPVALRFSFELEVDVLVFCGGRKTGHPGESRLTCCCNCNSFPAQSDRYHFSLYSDY